MRFRLDVSDFNAHLPAIAGTQPNGKRREERGYNGFSYCLPFGCWGAQKFLPVDDE